MTRVTKDREQEQGKYLGERPAACTAATFAKHLDPFGRLGAVVGDTLTAELALAVCRQFRAASGGAVCLEFGEQVDSDGNDSCEAFGGMRGVGIKTLNYIERKTNPVKNPRGYVTNSIKRATPDSPNLMGKSKEDSEFELAEMRSRAPSTVTVGDASEPASENIAELVAKVGKHVESDAEVIAEHKRTTRARVDYKDVERDPDAARVRDSTVSRP